ncbi:Lon protease family protein [Desulforhabdus amnigena]|uniref:endopeptidase La n=1 Tax=Desulforhabdus amnigena TaxID=40218 RepID=A0A9W6D0G8_9BACT|nr:ATP-binding protein [Desulforhabdus amnigena]NLJ26620.1 AAA family ATPase [Deltaproteobacteria bacterium]GLI33600.1 ATP-dependent protease [Desulforhabdus amnigena]
MPKQFPELSVNKLRAQIDESLLPFETTASLESLEKKVVGQDRAIDAIKFGMGMKTLDYNIFIAGPSKAGLTYMAKTFIEDQAKKEPTPPDWCYVYNFKEQDKPLSLRVTAGRGKQLKKDMNEFIQTLQAKIPEVFDSDDYRSKESEVHQGFEKQRREVIDELSQQAKDEGFILQFSQVGMVIIPANEEGEPMTQEDLRHLSDEEKTALREKSDALHEKMKEAIKRIREAENEFKEKHTKLDNEIALFVVGQLMDNIEEKYKDDEHVLDYLKMVQEDILENIEDFKKKPEAQQPQPGAAFPIPARETTFRKYDVNVLIDNSETEGAPVVIESNPAYPNLFGSIERQAWFGALFTDHTMIKPGSLHKANGGYLVMKALDLLKWYISYEAMKRALRDREIKIEDIGELYGLFSTRTIRPAPIPLNVKIILTGDPYIYQLLYTYDDRFQKLFKVKAHMDDQMERKDEAIVDCARMMSSFCKDHGLRHLDKSGVARVLEYSMELTENQEKLTLELGNISDLLKEANYFSSLDNSEFIQRKHVEEAIRKRIYRSNLIEERIKEYIEKDIFWVETEGEKVGQVNGLSVLMAGDHVFGKPNRITATVSVGREGMVSIDRESKMSGSTHTKGLMILTNLLKERFAQKYPISLTASLCFEQSYGMVDGDSASSTEFYVLVSAISKVPIRQGIAVTGSVSQKGEIQPIGGVNYKIEGFFDICKHKGLTGSQGVMIPSKNVRNLMLKQEVIDAVKEGKFHIWPVTTVEEGIEILTGMEAGKIQEDGTYPEGTVFRKVADRLQEITEIVKEFGKGSENGKKKEEESEGGCPHCGV